MSAKNQGRLFRLQTSFAAGTGFVCLLGFVYGCKADFSQTNAPETTNSALFAWEMKTTVEAYQHAGNTNAAWDEPAIRALDEVARGNANLLPSSEPWENIVFTNCKAAINAGCPDPLVRYLYAHTDRADSTTNIIKLFYDAAVDMQKSSYPSIRKFLAAERTLWWAVFAYGYTNVETTSLKKKLLPVIRENLTAVLQDKKTPPQDFYYGCSDFLRTFNGKRDDYAKEYAWIEPLLSSNWPDESASWLIKGDAYVDMAWNARSSGYASTVSFLDSVVFSFDLGIAESALNHAWELNPEDPRIAVKMLMVELGQGHDRTGLTFNWQASGQKCKSELGAFALAFACSQWYQILVLMMKLLASIL